jgi:hypothetical protein
MLFRRRWTDLARIMADALQLGLEVISTHVISSTDA